MALAAIKKALTHLEPPSIDPPSRPISGSSRSGSDVDTATKPNGLEPPTTCISGSSLKRFEQTWNYEKDEWTDVLRAPDISKYLTQFNKIAVYNRRDSKRSYRDHIWIELRSTSLVDLIKPFFQGLSGFAGLNPGVDARHVYTRRKVLEELLTDPESAPNDVQQAGSELRVLLDYVKEVFADITAQLDSINRETDPQIEWNRLWALFKSDDLVETKDFVSGDGCAFKLQSWVYEQPMYSEPRFKVRGQFLQWTGRRYAKVSISRDIEQYAGMQPVSALSIKQLTASRREEFISRGKKYIQLAGVNHLQYETSVMRVELDQRGCQQVVKEKADGRVMIDVLSFRHFNPNDDNWESVDLCHDCSKPNDWLLSLDEDHLDLCLLPPTIHGWSFAAKKWGQFLVEKLSDVSFQTDMLKHLVLPEDSKMIIRSLVEAQAGFRGISLFEDMISSKGSGLVILLHGSPGTGKTLTAEAITEHLKLPLYPVSCNEFGTTLESAEAKLKHILDITSLWKAIVLIDEADIFMEARSEDLVRNAVVGVFLRMLEYHSGIIILTTNRVRTLDEAFRSRISIALKYNDLDRESRKTLWEKFLNLAGATIQDPKQPGSSFGFSVDDIAKLSERETNGRVIKNIVRTAQALAAAHAKELNLNHIERVWRIMDTFEEDLRPAKHQ